MTIRRRLVVRGRVQGVFFRDSIRQRADQRSVAGWVQNNHDGTVEAVFEGAEEAVESLVAYCSEGPRGAEVEDVDVAEEEVEGLASFDVR